MIIQTRGTSGSGKSTVMRAVLDSLEWESVYWESRKRPIYYKAIDHSVVLLGHYESPCGGCDTVGSAKAVYELIQEVRKTEPRAVILCEGLLLSEDSKWSSQLPDLRVLFLVTPLEECLRRIRERRKAVGNAKPLNPSNTANRVAVIERARIRLVEAGVYCRRVTSKQATEIILKWLRERQYG